MSVIKKILPLFLILLLFTGCGYSQADLDAAYDRGYADGRSETRTEILDDPDLHNECAGYYEGYEYGQEAQFDEMYEEFYNERYWDGYDAGYYDAENGYDYDNIDVNWDEADSY